MHIADPERNGNGKRASHLGVKDNCSERCHDSNARRLLCANVCVFLCARHLFLELFGEQSSGLTMLSFITILNHIIYLIFCFAYELFIISS